MDINLAIKNLKEEPGFAEHVGMVLVHNGIVRGTTRNKEKIVSINVSHDDEKIKKICEEMEKQPGIFRVKAYANSGELKPGDDLMFLIVAGDIRENVKATFAEALDRIKSEAITKKEKLK